jgi:hypothetical protein
MLTEGIGAAFNSLNPVAVVSHVPSETFSSLVSPVCVDFSAELETCDCLSHVESDDPLGVNDISSSLGRVEVDAVPKLGDEVPEVARLGSCVFVGRAGDVIVEAVVEVLSWSFGDWGSSDSCDISTAFEVSS